ncbi:Uncharacterised protein [uncultured archaeon]|nr:Uncharacterised protein [uncultured archaeon]
MFDPNEESIVLEMVRSFFDIPNDEMMKIGDTTKTLLFDPNITSEEEAVGRLKDALSSMPQEHALIAGVFMSGLLRCNLAQQIQQQYMQAKEKEEDLGT